MPAVISISNLTKTYASGMQALKRVDLEIAGRRDLRAARAERRRQDDAHQHRLRHRDADLGHASSSTATTSCATTAQRASKIGLVPQELATDTFETVWAAATLQPRAVRAARATPRTSSSVLRDLSLWDQRDDIHHDAVGRHEAPGHDREGARRTSRASCSSTSRPRASTSSCAATCGRSCGGLRDQRRHDHPDHALHRRGRGDGRPHRRDQPRRAGPGRGEGDADEEARQASSSRSRCRSRWRRSRRSSRDWRLALKRDGNELEYTFDAAREQTGIPPLLRRLSSSASDSRT